jgi:hypothetical protein
MDEHIPVPELIRAINIYLDVAYLDAPQAKPTEFACLPVDLPLEKITERKGVQQLPGSFLGGRSSGTGYSFRLGNAHYRNMKLVIRSTDGGFILDVDTHDDIDPSLVPENQRDQLREMRDRNRAIAKAVLAEWENAGLPTQASVIREFLDKQRFEK